MKVYRVENPVEEHGLWRNFDGSPCDVFDRLTHGKSRTLPMPDNDFYREGGKQWFAATDTPEKLREWFDMLDIVQYLKQTYHLSEKPKLTENDDKTTKPFVFIIDEINRGEISKIFGELFFAIDPGYRGEKGKVKTQYQNLIDDDDEFYDGFYVPENVYIIGTMIDIDRSVESMDFAFRRRFAFKEIKADDRIVMLNDLPQKDKAVRRMQNLNKSIEKIEGLSSSYHIGPAYFLKLKNCNEDFQQLWDNHLEGLLREYLRGMQDVDEKINKLKAAYNNESDPNN